METRLLIDGELVAGEGAVLEIENPATEALLATVAAPSDAQRDAALDAARRAQPAWGRMPAGERAELLHEVAARLREHTEELARLMTSEGGKPLLENRDEVGWCVACFQFYAELARSSAGRVIPPIEDTQVAMVVREPLGVVACVVPWNYPLLLLCWKLAPVLAAGNAAVCKPSELTPLSTLALARCLDHLPPGVVALLAGDGALGAALVEDERVDGIAFTGSVATGRRIAVGAAQRLARVNLELGGKDPFLVCADLDDEALEVAARGAAWAAFLNAGQVCTSAERIYVEAPVHDTFVTRVVEHTRTLRVGDPFDDTTDVGPMASAAQRGRAEAHLTGAASAGASILVGGDRAGHERGHFLAPAVVTGADAQTDLLREETFGPIAPIVRVASLDEAIAAANGTRFGLGANVYTRDLRTAVRCLKELRAGTVWINDPLTDNDAGPFGGMGQSGLGRELGREGLEAFQEVKHVHLESVIARKDWWYPYGAGQGAAPAHG